MIEIRRGMVTDATLERAAGTVVLDPIAGEDPT